ncbi:hypothetical protein VTN31DRAFT_3312 [Thermomyces dupontii]|uniref:uncharacterized protein n=1 Tax=Talaromyces thermophilus TaxID=28565 RepID=UPI0037431564
MEYETENGRYDDDRRYDRDRSASPANGRVDDRVADSKPEGDDGAVNPGSNLFVTGIHPRLTEADLSRLFEKYGDVESCSIMIDPHTKESRGFGFVKMMTAEQADAAKEGLQGEVIEGRTLSIEKARRSRPRTPTPGKYYGPPKRDHRYGRGRRYDDRRGYGGRRYDDYRRGRYDSYDRRDRDRRDYGGYGGRDYGRDYPRDYGRRGDYRDDYSHRGGVDRYASGRDERYGRGDDRRDDRGDERRGGYYDRDANPPSYDQAPRDSREPYVGRSYESRGDERYGAR